MAIKFDDGSIINADDWQQIKRILAEKGQAEAKAKAVEAVKAQAGASNGHTHTLTAVSGPKVTEIVSRDGVTIKVGNLELKAKPKMPLAQPDYVSGDYKGWTVRVWKQERERIFGCNYFRGEVVRYFEVSYDDALDENRVFKYARQYIDNE